MLLPEIILQDLVRKLIKVTKADWLDVAVPDKHKLLTQLFQADDNGNELKVDKFSYLEGAKTIFLPENGQARKLETNFGYNRNRSGLPTIHILLPNESSANNSIGFGEDVEFDEEEVVSGLPTGYVIKKYGYSTTFNFMLSSDNTNEVLIMYYWLRNMLIASSDHLELHGLQNVSFSGQDLALSNELVSPDVFHRNLQLSFIYENKIVTNLSQQFRNRLRVL